MEPSDHLVRERRFAARLGPRDSEPVLGVGGDGVRLSRRPRDAGGGPTEPRPTYGAPLLASALY